MEAKNCLTAFAGLGIGALAVLMPAQHADSNVPNDIGIRILLYCNLLLNIFLCFVAREMMCAKITAINLLMFLVHLIVIGYFFEFCDYKSAIIIAMPYLGYGAYLIMLLFKLI